MITFLQGRLVEALPTQVTVDVHGVGYEVLIPLSSFDRLPAVGADVHLLTHLAVREDAHTLYGFITAAERGLFRLLINTVSGIGPKLALNMLSGMNAAGFAAAVAAGDVKALSGISGVGKKTAERIVVELRDKLGAFNVSPGGPVAAGTGTVTLSGTEAKLADATSALVALGFKQNDAYTAARAALTVLGETASVEQLVRACLKRGA
jgi:Holliday junction DNA helicase RuvA